MPSVGFSRSLGFRDRNGKSEATVWPREGGLGLKELTGESGETILPGEGFGLEGYPLPSLERLFDQTRSLGLGLGTHQRVWRDCLPREEFGVEIPIS